MRNVDSLSSGPMRKRMIQLVRWTLVAGSAVAIPAGKQSSTVNAQTPQNIISHAPFTEIGIDSWAGGGTGVVDVGSPASATSNPAALRLDALTAYVEFGKRLPATYLAGINYDNQYIAPAYVS